MRPPRLVPIACCIVLTACGSQPSPSARAEPQRGATATTVLRRLPPGAVVRLEPCSVSASGDPVSAPFVGALLREALRLSSHLDIASHLEDMPGARFTLRPRIDAAASLVTLALLEGDGTEAPLPVAAASFAERPLPRAIDELAWRARLALGEDVPAEPPSCADIYSASPTCVRETEAAFLDENRGLRGSRRERLDRALRSDPGCTVARAAQATTALLDGQPVEAARIAEGTMRALPERCSPTTSHRLQRTLWLARGAAATDPAAARRCDEELLGSADEFLAARPHDPHGRYTRALARANLGGFEAAVDDLRVLRSRWPDVPWVAYHLAFAELAGGQPDAALDELDLGARRLSPAWTFLPRALALYEGGHHDELDLALQRLAGWRRGQTDDRTLHEIRRVQAAHALLTDRPEQAVRHLLEDLEWLRERPSAIDQLTQDLIDDGDALIAIGHGEDLAIRLAAFRDLPIETPNAALAATYLGGRLEIGRDPDAVRTAVASLERAGWRQLAARLAAAAALDAGDPNAAVAALERSLALHDDPRVAAELAVALRAAGLTEQAEHTAQGVRERLGTLRLRGPLEHPLLGPGLARAWRLCGGAAPVNRGA